MSDIFGIGAPKFTGTGDPDSSTRTLLHSLLDPKFSEKVQKIFESPVSSAGTRTVKSRGRYATFYVEQYIFKYDTDPAIPITARQQADLLLSYENKPVIFYPFKDGLVAGDGLGKAIKNASNNTVYCQLIDLDFQFAEPRGCLYDKVLLTFITNEFWDIRKLIQ